ncbi:cell wall hydrolase [Oceaniglobus roseus]|uniref:cell wall hydrolase n=1 Tax=Oceaniglobus roseus TaxID=1737570 RepID=UPI000C7E9CEC|nr:cell wall hydrolase [Kandeliimicrobium roseum]
MARNIFTLTNAILIGAVLLVASCGGRRERHGRDAAECMQRAIYFESNRSSRDGMIAVGSVVMNRVASDDFPDTVCGVVSQRGQFAAGLMTREMGGRGFPLVREAAAAVLAGERHPLIGNARFFHAASYRAHYNNIHYVVTAGGNAFYEKRPPALVTQRVPLPPVEGLTP